MNNNNEKPVHVFKLNGSEKYYIIFPLTGNIYVTEGQMKQLVGKVKGVNTFLKDVRELGTYTERKQLSRLPEEVQKYITTLRRKNR